MNKLDYLAGLIDGDGCFNLYRIRSTYVPRIMVVNTNKEIMDWLKDNFGGLVTKTSVKDRPTWKSRYTWSLSHQKSLDLAYILFDKLVIKRDACAVFVTWRAVRDLYKNKDFTEIDRNESYIFLASKLKKWNLKGRKPYAVA